MTTHDELLQDGPRVAPEPETADQWTARAGKKGLAGGVMVGGGFVAKLAGVGKVAVWLFAFDGGKVLWHVFGIAGLVVVVASVVFGVYVHLRSERGADAGDALARAVLVVPLTFILLTVSASFAWHAVWWWVVFALATACSVATFIWNRLAPLPRVERRTFVPLANTLEDVPRFSIGSGR